MSDAPPPTDDRPDADGPAGSRPAAPDRAAVVHDVLRTRRTSLLVDADAPVPPEVVDRLIDAATWAPNHKRTWPWRFTVLTGDARGRFGEALAAAGGAAGLDPSKVAKLPGKYRRSPVVVLVWVAVDADPVRAREDRDATAAAVQNLLVAATAEGLGSYWGSLPDALVPAARSVAEVDGRHDPVALVYLGHPTGTVPTPPRPTPIVTRLDG